MNNSTNEKDRRHYASVKAENLGNGGVEYISRLPKYSRQTIYIALAEMEKIERVRTKTGLQSTCNILSETYETDS